MTLTSRLIIIVAMLAAIVGIGGFILTRGNVAQLPVEAVTGSRPKITEPRVESVPTIAIAKPVGWAAGETPKPASGLAVRAFASGLDHPRWLYELPNGDVLVAESNSPPREKEGIADYVMGWLLSYAGAGSASANRITLLRDANGDGVAELKTPFLTGLNSPFGMALVGDKLYVANHDSIVMFPYTPGTTRIAVAPQKVMALPGGGNHWTRNIVASRDGKSLFVAVGSASNIGERGLDRETNRAAILELDLTTRKVRVFSAGLRNPVGMAFDPVGDRLWTVVNERDMLGGDLAPDYLALAQFGAFYGWPYSYWGGYVDPRVREARPDLLQYTKRPEYALGAHTASLGLTFGSLGGFRNGAFIGQHGSWNRQPPSGYKVTFVPFGPTGYPNGAMRDVLTGFLDDQGRARGRPAGVLADSKGALLVADDVGNVIWRATAQPGAQTAAR